MQCDLIEGSFILVSGIYGTWSGRIWALCRSIIAVQLRYRVRTDGSCEWIRQLVGVGVVGMAGATRTSDPAVETWSQSRAGVEPVTYGDPTIFPHPPSPLPNPTRIAVTHGWFN